MKKSTNKTKEAATMYETENDIAQPRRLALIGLMNQRLADAVDLQTQMKQAHWNVKGPHFIGLHELFDQIDEAVESYVDLIAERIVQLGGVAEGTARSAAARSRLEEYPLTIADGHAHVESVFLKYLGRSCGGARRLASSRLAIRPAALAIPTPSYFQNTL